MKTKMILLIALALTAAGCSSSQSGPCRAIKAVDNSALLDQLDPRATPDTLKSQFAKVQTELESLKKDAPATLSADVDTYLASINKIDQVLATVSYDGARLVGNAELNAQISKASQDAQSAAKNIDDYYQKSCK